MTDSRSISKTKATTTKYTKKFIPNDQDLPSVTRRELAYRLQTNYHLDFALCRAFIDLFFEIIRDRLLMSETVKLSSFGTFSVVSKSARPGLNISTREKVLIAPRKVVRFKPSKKLRMQDYLTQLEADNKQNPIPPTSETSGNSAIFDIIKQVQEKIS